MTDFISHLTWEMPGNGRSLGSFPRGYIPYGIYTPRGKCPTLVEMVGNKTEAVS